MVRPAIDYGYEFIGVSLALSFKARFLSHAPDCLRGLSGVFGRPAPDAHNLFTSFTLPTITTPCQSLFFPLPSTPCSIERDYERVFDCFIHEL